MAPGQTGIWFTNVLPEARYLTNQILPNGSGVAAGDVDGDSFCDVYFCGLNSPNRLYRNLGGWKFQDVTETAGVACVQLDATGAAFADLDGDRDLDLVVNSIAGGTHIFFNDGSGHFTPNSQRLNAGRGGTSLALADADADGDLDLYIANYRAATLMDAPGTRFSVKMVGNRPEVSAIDGRPLSDPEWTNRFRFKIGLGPGGRGTFSHEELGEPDLFCRNDGKGNFEPVSWTDGTFLDEDGQPLREPPFDWGLTVTFRDFNGDGSPDLYVCNDFGTPDRFWLNDGHGRFRAAPRLALRQSSLAAMSIDVADLNRDGHDDFIVVEMLSRDHRRRLTQRNVVAGDPVAPGTIDGRPQYPRNMLFVNHGDGTYAEIAQYSGVEASEWSWAPVFLDVDLDGYEDLLVANGFERDNMNVDVQNQINQAKSASRVRTREELLLRRMFPRLETENLAFRNVGGLRFEPVSLEWGFDATAISQGVCLADLDNDGDLDVAVNNMNDAAGLYRNDAVASRVAVRLNGVPPNSLGIGAKIRLIDGAVPMQSQEIISGGRYLSGDDPVRTFAAGGTTDMMRIEVLWRSGRRSVVTGVEANRLYEIEEAAAMPAEQAGRGAREQGSGGVTSITDHGSRVTNPPPVGAESVKDDGKSQFGNRKSFQLPPLFEDVSHLLSHTHIDEPFDDFSRQPLLPKRLGQLGPGVSWFDLNADGWEDLVIAAGRGGKMAAYLNDGKGGFTGITSTALSRPITRSQTTVLASRTPDGGTMLLAGSSNYDDGLATGASVRKFDLAKDLVDEGFPGTASSTGPLALADIDGDGDLDLFVGGRTLPGKYPAAAASALYRNEDQRFKPDQENIRVVQEIGLASGAVFSDLDGDGFPELIVACESGPIRIFRNERGKFSPWNPDISLGEDSARERLPANPSSTDSPSPMTNRQSQIANRKSQIPQRSSLNQLTGWWNGVTTGDFDGDGHLDIVASNWGQNSKYERFRPHPLRIYYGDFDGEGTVDLFEAHYDLKLRQFVPDRMLDVMTRAIPALAERFATHAAYAQASIDEALADWTKRARYLEAVWLESTVFLNRPGRFEVVVLPMEAQWSPGFGVCVGDCDGDGREDIFLSQNFFHVSADTSRYDAGCGLWLHGNGHGRFRAMPSHESGVKVHGEQRGAGVCDYDADGRLDLVVTQNSAATRLFHNTQGRPGLRIRLEGLAANPQGIGAVLRLRSGDVWGPAREIHAGAGYWSQDSAVQVMAPLVSPLEVSVRWPGGKTSVATIPEGSREILVSIDGKARGKDNGARAR